MRIGLDLRSVEPVEGLALAVEADELGLWAVLIGGRAGTESVAAAAVAVATEHVHLAVWLDGSSAHPLTLAEEMSVLDHLSRRRVIVVVDGPASAASHVERLLGGHIVDGVALTPPPAQTAVQVRTPDRVPTIALSGDLAADRPCIDAARDGGTTHLIVTWPGDLRVLARHLATRALVPDFPQIVADQADIIAP